MWGRSIRVTRLGGFDIRIDASWLLIAGLIIWSLASGYFPDLLPDANGVLLVIAATISMLGLFVSLILHELAHSVVARMHGLEIEGITLFLFGGVAEMKTEPEDPVVEFRVAIAGPLASLALAGLFWSASLVATVAGLGAPILAVVGYLALINLVLALFNMVPALPLDGGRVFRAYLWRQSGDFMAATRRAAWVSAAFAWGLIGLGLLVTFGAGPTAGLWPILLGVFLLAMGRATYQQAEMKVLLGDRAVSDLMSRAPITVHPGLSLSDVVNRVFLSEGVSFAPVVEDGALLGYIDLHIIRRIDRENWTTTSVDDVVEGLSEEATIRSDAPARTLLERMARTGQSKFMVVDDHDLKGVVTLTDVTGYLDVSRQLA